jgi:hypothetical protein
VQLFGALEEVPRRDPIGTIPDFKLRNDLSLSDNTRLALLDIE